MRVIVTGSRLLESAHPVRAELYDLLNNLAPNETLTVVHGDCPTGADRHASNWVADQHYDTDLGIVIEERHPADWNMFGPAAGPRRNSEMVALGADLVLAFPVGASRGTRDTMTKARAAGILVQVTE